jgi:hypothetical protein
MAEGMGTADLELFERSLRHATTNHTGIELDRALGELGWHDAIDIDRQAAVSLLFELQGAANVTSSALDHVVASALGLEHGTTSVVLPPLGRWSPPGELDGEQLRIGGLATASVGRGGDTLVVAAAADKELAFVVATTELVLREIHGVDPWAAMLEVTAEGIGVGSAEAAPTAWSSAVALGQLAVAHELLGASRTMLDLARDHALERIQFGRPISSFQAIRHRLAETLVAIETADAMVAMAWEDETPQSAAMAKALAGRGARTAARHCQQVLAGIGFTTEHPLHRYIRRVLVLDELFGSARLLTGSLGRQLIDDRQLPPVLPL